MTPKDYVQMAVILGTVAVSGIVGGTVGYEIRDRLATSRAERCAASILEGNTTQCRVEIQNALGQVTMGAKEKEIEYRDRTIPVFVADSTRDAELERMYADRVAALSNVEKTNACAASPAFRLRREQLLDSEGPAVRSEPDADQNPG